MTAAAFAGWAVEALVASALLMLLVLAVRVPVRRAFGARVSYALWVLPALRLALPPLPEAWRGGAAMPLSDAAGGIGAQAASALTYVTVISTRESVTTTASGTAWGAIVLGAWAAGAAALLLWQLADYHRFRARVLRTATPLARIGRVAVVESRAAAGPVAFGIVHRVVAFPVDFEARYDAGERDLALAHELGHHARGDLVANWVALATLALHWWNPLAWAAFRAFRADQEMANDAGVLARVGAQARHAYGCAIVKAAHGRAVTATCHLHSVRDLKGRLKMLNRREGSGARLAAGMIATATLTLGGLFATASGSAAAARVKETVASTTGMDLALLAAVDAFQAGGASPEATPGTSTRKHTRVIVTKDGKTQTYEGAAADAYIAANPVPVPPPPPVPPVPGAVPPAPPVPPIPPVPGATGDSRTQVYTYRKTASDPAAQTWGWDGKVPPVPPVEVSSRNCRVGPDGPETQTTLQRQKGRTQVTVICTNRIQKMAERAGAEAERAARASVDAEGIRRTALASAITSLRASRESIAGNRDMPEADRAEALKEMDDAIKEVEAEARSGA